MSEAKKAKREIISDPEIKAALAEKQFKAMSVRYLDLPNEKWIAVSTTVPEKFTTRWRFGVATRLLLARRQCRRKEWCVRDVWCCTTI